MLLLEWYVYLPLSCIANHQNNDVAYTRFYVPCRAEKAAGLRWLHMQASKRYKLWNDLLSVPVVITSTLAGLGQLSADSCGKTFTILLTIVNLTSAVLVSTDRYLCPGEKASTHAAIASDYSKLYRYIVLYC